MAPGRPGASEIWRVGPAGRVIRPDSPGNREPGARFGESRDWCAKFAERRLAEVRGSCRGVSND